MYNKLSAWLAHHQDVKQMCVMRIHEEQEQVFRDRIN